MVQPQVCPPQKKNGWEVHTTAEGLDLDPCFSSKKFTFQKQMASRHPAGQLTFKKAKVPKKDTLQGINISHLGKRKIIFKMSFWGDMLDPWRVFRKTKKKTAPLFFPKRGKPGVFRPNFPWKKLTPFCWSRRWFLGVFYHRLYHRFGRLEKHGFIIIQFWKQLLERWWLTSQEKTEEFVG